MPILVQTAQSPFGGLPGQTGFYKLDNTPFVPTGTFVATYATSGFSNGNSSINATILNASISAGVATATLTGSGNAAPTVSTHTFGSNLVSMGGSVYSNFDEFSAVMTTADSTLPNMVNTCVIIDQGQGFQVTITLPTSTYDLPASIVTASYYSCLVMIADPGAGKLYFISCPSGTGTATTWPVTVITTPGSSGGGTQLIGLYQSGLLKGYVINTGDGILFYNTNTATVDWIYSLPSGQASINAPQSSPSNVTLVTGGLSGSLYVFDVTVTGLTPLWKSNAGALGSCSLTSLISFQRFGGPYTSTAIFASYLPPVGTGGYVLIDLDLTTGQIYAQEDVYEASPGQVSDGGSVSGSGQEMANIVGIARIPWGSGILPQFLGNSTSGGTPLQGLLSVYSSFSAVSSNPFTALTPGVVSTIYCPVSQVAVTTSTGSSFAEFPI